MFRTMSTHIEKEKPIVGIEPTAFTYAGIARVPAQMLTPPCYHRASPEKPVSRKSSAGSEYLATGPDQLQRKMRIGV